MSCYTNSYNTMNNQRNTGDMSSGGYMPNMQQNGKASVPNMQTRQNMQPQTGTPANNAITTARPRLPGMSETPTTVQSPYYTAGFLSKFIGRNMRVEFLIGTNGPLVDRIGTLKEVGASYIVLQPYLSDDLLMCDLYSIKFVTIYD